MKRSLSLTLDTSCELGLVAECANDSPLEAEEHELLVDETKLFIIVASTIYLLAFEAKGNKQKVWRDLDKGIALKGLQMIHGSMHIPTLQTTVYSSTRFGIESTFFL